jgi:hypothetical protein
MKAPSRTKKYSQFAAVQCEQVIRMRRPANQSNCRKY